MYHVCAAVTCLQGERESEKEQIFIQGGLHLVLVRWSTPVRRIKFIIVQSSFTPAASFLPKHIINYYEWSDTILYTIILWPMYYKC